MTLNPHIIQIDIQTHKRFTLNTVCHFKVNYKSQKKCQVLSSVKRGLRHYMNEILFINSPL